MTESTTMLAMPEHGLLDVLEQLPRTLLRESLWSHLVAPPPLSDEPPGPFRRGFPRSPGWAFRATCTRSRLLSDQLTRWAKLHCYSGMGVEAVAANLQANSAFLSRQEGLEELHLDERRTCFNDDGVVPRTLSLSGDACRRVQTLRLDMCSDTNALVGEAIQAHCPQLSNLCVLFYDVDATFFVQLRGCRNLTRLTMATTFSYEFMWPGDAVLELLLLPGLRCVQLEGLMEVADFQNLAALPAVQELRLSGLTVRAAHEDAARVGILLGGMTQLLTLEEPAWETPGHEQCEFLNTVAAQLGGLRRLTSLLIGASARYDERDEDELALLGDGFTALCQLPALTSLSCLGIGPQQNDRGGCLPLLQHLELFGDHSPHSLATSLRPLRPLPSLHKFVATVCLVRTLRYGEVEEPGARGRAVAATREAATLLASAPQLQDIDLSLNCGQRPPSDQATTIFITGVTVELLGPLLERVVTLRLVGLPEGCVGVLWPLLLRATRLQTLHVSGCSLSEEQLRCVGRDMPVLSELRVCQAGVSKVGMALVAVHALHVCAGWSPWRGVERNGEVQAWRTRERS